MKSLRSIAVKLRDYQQEAFNKVIASSEHTLVVLPCGSGKSLIMSELVNYFSNNGKKVLFVVHRNNLLDQFSNHLKRYDNLNCDVLSPLRALNSNNDYDIIFIDETHHATSKSFQNVFNKFDTARRIGFTATPIRLSGERLAKPINQFRSAPFDKVINTITINELIQRGFLSPFDVKAGDWTLYFDNRTIKTVAGEFSSKSISEAFKTDKLKELVENFKELAEDRKTIAYTSSIKMAEQLAEELNNQGIVAKAFHSKLSAQQVDEYIEQFKNNQIKVCVNVDLFGEGFDVPDCDCVLMLRPTKSLSLYIQQFMRCMRIDPNNPNKRALIIDFANNTKIHGGLLSAELRMRMKQENELLKFCPQCETLNYAKAKICDNPDCRFKFPAGGGLAQKKQPEEIKMAVEMSVVDYTIENELKSIAKLDTNLIDDITTKFIHILAVGICAKDDKKMTEKLKTITKTPLFNHIKQVEPNLEVINLFSEQIGGGQYDMDYFRNKYKAYLDWKREMVNKRKDELVKLKTLAKYYNRQLSLPYVEEAKKQEYREWLLEYKQNVKKYFK